MEPKLADLLGQSEHKIELCAAFAWLWLAAADGSLDLRTHAFLERELECLPGTLRNRDALLSIIAADDLPSFLLACRVLQRDLSVESRAPFLSTAVGVAVAGGELSVSANHILRLFADMLDVNADALGEIFRETSGELLEEPPDLSSVAWWRAQAPDESKEQFQSRHGHGSAGATGEEDAEDHTRYRYIPGRRFSRTEALAVLGLQRGAARAEIKRAYRRLAQNYHPDRQRTLSSEARRRAEEKFLRVQQAYEVLKQ
jgi:DnaJ-domain-containing protein 1